MLRPPPKLYRGKNRQKPGVGYGLLDSLAGEARRVLMASAATNPAGNFSAAGNGAARQTVTCAGGSQAILEEDLVRWLPTALTRFSGV